MSEVTSTAKSAAGEVDAVYGQCRNCGAELHGRWCSACGQKVLEERDRRLSDLLGHFFAELFKLDGKLPRTLGVLLFQPGHLSVEHLQGRRVRYLSPIALFLLVNVAYFIAPPLTDFNISLSNQLHQPYGALLQAPVEQRLQQLGMEMAEYEAIYDQRVNQVAKSMIIVHLPLLALLLMLMQWRQPLYFAEHFVLATHMFSAVLLIILLFSGAFALLYLALSQVTGPVSWLMQMLQAGMQLLLLSILLYFLLALKRGYGLRWPGALLMLLGFLPGLLLVHMFIYRPLQFMLVFALTAP